MSLENQRIGRYQLGRPIGRGGMGEVYLAEDTYIQRQVAIKVIQSDGDALKDERVQPQALRVFEREMRAIAKLDHPHILSLYDYGEEVVDGYKLAYMVMPYREEGSLAHWLRHTHSEPLAVIEVNALLQQAAEAIQFAHDQGIVHQDIKPSNFLIRQHPRRPGSPDLLLADFGIAKFLLTSTSSSQSIKGTPIYMAPEQWQGKAVPASDQYSLAIMVYDLLTGQQPFKGHLGELMYKHLNELPQPPSQLNAKVARELDSILLRALAKKPEERFESISAFAMAFEQLTIPSGELSLRVSSEHTSLPPLSPPQALPTDIQARVSISEDEALLGTQRMITLLDGHELSVMIPAGTQNGQLIVMTCLTGSRSDSSSEKKIIVVEVLLTPVPPLQER
jgi:eukaryotic-like serine/threonine-protein kinase